MLVICTVLNCLLYEQLKGEFIIFGHTRLLHVCLMAIREEQVTLVHVLLLTINEYLLTKVNICLKH